MGKTLLAAGCTPFLAAALIIGLASCGGSTSGTGVVSVKTTVGGTMKDLNGTPVAGAQIILRAERGGASAVVAADGGYSMEMERVQGEELIFDFESDEISWSFTLRDIPDDTVVIFIEWVVREALNVNPASIEYTLSDGSTSRTEFD